MDLGSAVRVLLRRWVVLVFGIALTLGMTAYLSTQSEPRYQATANMILLLQPDARGAADAGSPFLYLPNGLQTLAAIVVVGPESREFRQNLYQQGFTSQFEIGVQVGSPIITVSAEGPDPANVVATRDMVIMGLQAELVRVQQEEKTPARQTAHTRVYGNDDIPTRLGGDRIRGMLLVIAVGGLLTLMATFAIDRVLILVSERRRRRKDARGTQKRKRKRRPSIPAEPASSAEKTAATDATESADTAATAVAPNRRSGLRRPVVKKSTPPVADGPGKEADADPGDQTAQLNASDRDATGSPRVRVAR